MRVSSRFLHRTADGARARGAAASGRLLDVPIYVHADASLAVGADDGPGARNMCICVLNTILACLIGFVLDHCLVGMENS